MSNTTKQQTPASARPLTPAETEALAAMRSSLDALRARKAASGAVIVKATRWTPDFRPAEVVVQCVASKGGCGKEHTRAVQDVHQALLCPSCKADADKAKRAGKRGGSDRRAEAVAMASRLADLI